MSMTYTAMDNWIYGLIKEQISPSSATGSVIKTTPRGNIEKNVTPLELALLPGTAFIAQDFSSNVKGLTKPVENAISHDRLSFVNVFSPCVTYNRINIYGWFKEYLTGVDDIENYDSIGKQLTAETVVEYESLVTGTAYQDKETPSYKS